MPTCEFIISYRKGESECEEGMDRMALSLAVAKGE
jgi:hypothetical protein